MGALGALGALGAFQRGGRGAEGRGAMARRGARVARAALAALFGLVALAVVGGALGVEECTPLGKKDCKKSTYCLFTNKRTPCSVAPNQCAAIQGKRKRARCNSTPGCQCTRRKGKCGACAPLILGDPTPNPTPNPTPPVNTAGWISAWATNYGDYNTVPPTRVACSDCEGCMGLKDVGKTPCVTAVGGAAWGNPVCKKAGCYAVRCTGARTVQPTCKNSDAVIVQVVDACGACQAPGTAGQHVFDMNNQAFFEITQGGEGPINIEYKEVDCSLMPPMGLSQSCKIAV